MTTHAQEFVSDMRKRDQARAHWISRWPYFCSLCEGYGVSTGEGEITQPCDCALSGRCPRCGAAKSVKVTDHDPVVITICTACGWNLTTGGLPT